MKRIIVESNTKVICIGKRGENDATQIVFPIGEYKNQYGNGYASLLYKYPGINQEAYPVYLTQTDSEAVWTVKASDTKISGNGELQLYYIVGDSIAKSIIYQTKCMDSITKPGTVPDSEKAWVDEVVKAGTKAEAFSKLSESFTHGKTGVRPNEDTDNAKEYNRKSKDNADISESNKNTVVEMANQVSTDKGIVEQFKIDAQTARDESKKSEINAKEAIKHEPKIIDGIWHVWDAEKEKYVSTGQKATPDLEYENLVGKPLVNNVELVGNKTLEELGIQAKTEYTIEEVKPTEGYLKSYQFMKDGVAVGIKIDIPKDMVIKSGLVMTVIELNHPYVGAMVGDKYIDLVIANTESTHVYIPVKDLVDVYEPGEYILIDDHNQISVIVDDTLSGTSTNPIQNKVVNKALNEKLEKNQGVVNANKYLRIDEFGNVVPMDIPQLYWS